MLCSQFTFIGHITGPVIFAALTLAAKIEFVSAVSDPTVASRAGADRSLRVEPQSHLWWITHIEHLLG
mgnify:CR=1 FL=1